MLQRTICIAAIAALSTGLAITTAGAQPGKGHGGGPAHAAPAAAPRAAPAPHAAAPAPRAAPAPHVAAPRPAAAPHVAAPHVAAQAAKPHGGGPARAAPAPRPAPHAAAARATPPASSARHAASPRAPAPPQARGAGTTAGGQAGSKLAQPNAGEKAKPAQPPGRDNLASPAQGAGAAARVGGPQNAAPQNQPNRALQAAGGNRAAVAGREALRNQVFASRSGAHDPSARALARSTFQGHFFNPQWRLRQARPVVIGWAGPLYWPYAYSDFVDYTFYPYAYDTFWPYAYDDVYEGMFGAYAWGYGSAYAQDYDGRTYGRRHGRSYAARAQPSGSARSVGADLCIGQTAGLTDWPIERIAQTVEPNDAQRALLGELRAVTEKALDLLRASCPTALPSTPTGRIEAMHQRLDAMLQAVRIVRPALERFYQSLNDEQKARFNALGPDSAEQQAQRDLTQVCGQRAAGISVVPLEGIERAVRPSEAQRGALRQLQDATSQAANLLQSDCPTYRALTPLGRLEAMEQRLDAMLRAVQTVQPALERFYGSLSDEQKERFNRLGSAQG
jgi:ABC-type transporter MlaC component